MVSSGHALSVAQCARRALRSSRPAWSTDLRGTCIGKRNKTVSVTKVWHKGCKRYGLYRWGVCVGSHEICPRGGARAARQQRRAAPHVRCCSAHPRIVATALEEHNFKGAGLGNS